MQGTFQKSGLVIHMNSPTVIDSADIAVYFNDLGDINKLGV
jgi:hypothetical protein